MAKLKIVITNKLVEFYELRGKMVLGRGKEADILLLDPSVSRAHSTVYPEEDEFYVEDLGSANGTFVNDQQVVGRLALQEGDIVRIGTKILIFTRIEMRPRADVEVDLFSSDLDSNDREAILASPDILFIVPSSEDKMEGVYSLAKQLLVSSALNDEEADGLNTALREAIGNAIRHGNKYDESMAVRVRCIRDVDKVICAVEDEGPGFDYVTALDKGYKGDAISAARERYLAGGMGGLGIMLMIRCVDLVEYSDKGNRVIITKCRGDFFKDETVIESNLELPPLSENQD